MTKELPHLIAHRGNDRATLSKFCDQKPYGIEMDAVHFDGALYLYHPAGHTEIFGDSTDEVIDSELRARKASDTLRQLNLVDVIPDLLQRTSLILLDLKQKDPTALPEIVKLVKSIPHEPSQIVLGARTITQLNNLQQLGGQDFTVLSLSGNPDDYPEFIERGVVDIRLWEAAVTPARVADIHNMGASVWVTPGHPTENGVPGNGGESNPELIVRLARLGVDYILVNDLEMAQSSLQDLSS